MPQAQIPSPTQTQASSQPFPNSAYINQIKAVMRSKNPAELLANMAASNPQVRQVLQMAANGGDLQALAQRIAQAGNIDLNALVHQLME